MKKLYEKNELLFTVVIAVVHLVLGMFTQDLSWLIGGDRLIPAIGIGLESVFLYLWISKNGMKERCGLCGFKESEKNVNRCLYWIPLTMLVVFQFVRGIQINDSVLNMILYTIIGMGTGFLEEIIYRGFLFKALCKNEVGMAIVISSFIFGTIHLNHLLWGKDLPTTLMQFLYAGAVGFLFCVIFYEGKSLWPCIITHGLINSCRIFVAEEVTLLLYLEIGMAMCIISMGFAVYFLKLADVRIMECIE